MISKVVLLILISLLAASCFSVPLNGRIVNGTDAAPGEIPYIISLRLYGSHNCGGSILDETRIVTAGHCVYGNTAASLSIQYGVTEITSGDSAPNLIQVSKIIQNPDFDYGSGYNDVAIIELEKPMVFSENARPVNLPAAYAETPADRLAVLAGWGYPYTNGPVMTKLQRVDLVVFSDDACEADNPGAGPGPADRKYNVCAGVPEGGKGQCNGDSGGPLLCDGVLVGIVSWSIKPCASAGKPGVFTKVSGQVPWIEDQISL